MKFSVILANYNGERYLAEAIESVLHQTYSDFEFIIVDDGSTDTSKEIIEKYKSDRRIYFLNQRENQGQANAFNLGIQKAECEIVCFIDSDDLWMPNKLKSLDYLVKISGNVAFYQSNLFFIQDDVKTDELFRPILTGGNIYQETLRTRRIPLFVPTSGLSFVRAVLRKIGPIPEQFRTCADGYLTRTAMCFGSVSNLSAALGYYRIHENNCTFNNPDYDEYIYKNRLLIPALNNFYEKNNLELKLMSFRGLFIFPLDSLKDQKESKSYHYLKAIKAMCLHKWIPMLKTLTIFISNLSIYEIVRIFWQSFLGILNTYLSKPILKIFSTMKVQNAAGEKS